MIGGTGCSIETGSDAGKVFLSASSSALPADDFGVAHDPVRDHFRADALREHHRCPIGSFQSYDAIVDHCCDAWNKLTDRPWLIMSIGLRSWARRS
jgi:hypothetical protein